MDPASLRRSGNKARMKAFKQKHVWPGHQEKVLAGKALAAYVSGLQFMPAGNHIMRPALIVHGSA